MRERLFLAIDRHLLEDEQPSIYLQKQLDAGALDTPPYTIFAAMANTKQNPKYHPEGDVFAHTLLVIDRAANYRGESADPRAFMWAALLHDVGKPETTKRRKGKITAYNHDITGATIARRFLENFTDEKLFVDRVVSLVRFHMQPFLVSIGRSEAALGKLAAESDYREVALLSLCDRLGRLDVDETRERHLIEQFITQMEALPISPAQTRVDY